MMDFSAVLRLDEARPRLVRRFGDGVQAWLDELPAHLLVFRERWGLELDSVIPRGSLAVVIRCRTRAGRRAVLKLSPDRERLALECAALTHWSLPDVPAVLQADAATGALLLEAIAPGTSLQEAGTYPALGEVARLLTALHTRGTPTLAVPSVADRVNALFTAWARVRERDPSLVAAVPPALFDRGWRFARRLATEPSPTVFLHGDFTPVNLLDGGARRGLVAIDPAPCLGDPAFDAIDLLVWQADDHATLTWRAEQLAPALGVGAARLLDWCRAFAGMVVLDLVGPGQRAEPADERQRAWVRVALDLAAQVPSL